jgi:hypothetical protein
MIFYQKSPKFSLFRLKMQKFGLWLHLVTIFSKSQEIRGLDENITTLSSQRYQSIITKNTITEFNITWNSITKLKSE